MRLKRLLSFCLCTSTAFASPPKSLVAGETAIDGKLAANLMKTHLHLGLDSYASARDAYEARGTEALIQEMPELTADNQAFLKATLGSPKSLPPVTLENDNTLVVNGDMKAEVLSLDGGANLKINQVNVRIGVTGSFEQTYREMEAAFAAKPVSYHFSLVRSAYAADKTSIALGIVAILAAGFFGAKSFSNFRDEQASQDGALVSENAGDDELSKYRQTHGLESDGSRTQYAARGFGRLSSIASRFWSHASTKDKPASQGFYPGGAWSSAISRSIDRLGPQSRMMTQPPADLLHLCPKFATMSETNKKLAWAAIFDGMAMAESGHNPGVRYVESFGFTLPGTKRREPVISRGLLQISWLSARGHGGACASASSQNLHDPDFNLSCGVKIMEDQLRRKNALFPESSYYWSILSVKSGFKNFSSRFNYVKNQPGRWPAAACAGAK